MAGFSNTFETRVLTWVFTASATTRPSAWYVALSTTTPADDETGFTEPVGNNYARTTVTLTVSGDTASNASPVTFPEASGTWGTITYLGIYDASSSGKLIAFGQLTVNKSIGNGDTAQFAASAITITLD